MASYGAMTDLKNSKLHCAISFGLAGDVVR